MTAEPLRRAIFNRRMLICVFTGFSSGLPLFFLLNLVPAWLRSEQVDLKAIGLLTLIQLPYTWKFLWSPLVDRYAPPLGRRRGWMFATQLGLLLAIAAFGVASPAGLTAPQVVMQAVPGGWFALPVLDVASLLAFLSHPVALIALATAVFSATQDIALDAYRRELLQLDELGLGNSVHVTAYRLAGLVPGSLSLILADFLPWSQVFIITALFMVPGLLLTCAIREPVDIALVPKTLRAAAIEPMREFFSRAGWRQALWVLGFIFFYKLGDSLCTALATPFYLDMGYSKTEIGLVAKNAGLWASVGGGLIGGVWMLRLGIARSLWLFGVVQMLSILGFAWLAFSNAGPGSVDGWQWLFPGGADASALLRLTKLAAVVGLEAFGVGVGTAAFVAFIASQTHVAHTATQLALFTSLMAVPRTLINASAGYLVAALGWPQFYLLCFALALPGMLLLVKVAPWPISARGIPAE
jgi:PAT family beta-lactamase induction signal transducer AmpG